MNDLAATRSGVPKISASIALMFFLAACGGGGDGTSGQSGGVGTATGDPTAPAAPSPSPSPAVSPSPVTTNVPSTEDWIDYRKIFVGLLANNYPSKCTDILDITDPAQIIRPAVPGTFSIETNALVSFPSRVVDLAAFSADNTIEHTFQTTPAVDGAGYYLQAVLPGNFLYATWDATGAFGSGFESGTDQVTGLGRQTRCEADGTKTLVNPTVDLALEAFKEIINPGALYCSGKKPDGTFRDKTLRLPVSVSLGHVLTIGLDSFDLTAPRKRESISLYYSPDNDAVPQRDAQFRYDAVLADGQGIGFTYRQHTGVALFISDSLQMLCSAAAP